MLSRLDLSVAKALFLPHLAFVTSVDLKYPSAMSGVSAMQEGDRSAEFQRFRGGALDFRRINEQANFRALQRFARPHPLFTVGDLEVINGSDHDERVAFEPPQDLPLCTAVNVGCKSQLDIVT